MALKPPIHGRDHCPGGADPIPCMPGNRPWIALENPGQTLASGSFKHSRFTDAYYDSSLLTGNPDSTVNTDSYFKIESATEDAFNYWELTTKLEGWYTAEFVHLWSNLTSLTTSPAYGAQQITFNTTGIHFFHDGHIGDSADWTNATDELEGHAYIHTYRTVWLPADKAWPAFVKQVTGDNRDVSGHLKVWYEAGNFGGSSDNATWTFDGV